MTDSELLGRIDAVDWAEFAGPARYDPSAASTALRGLVQLESSENANEIGNSLLNALGSNHAGVYYPAVIEALAIIDTIAKSTSNPVRARCAKATLNDIYYFEPEVGHFTGMSGEELKKFVRDKLNHYSDEAC